MIQTFISIRFLDVLDIVLVAFLLYQIYLLLRGTVAFNIFVGLFAVYLIWLLVKALDMSLLSTILGQFIGVGVIALIIVFQQELRRFLLLIGSRYLNSSVFSIDGIIGGNRGMQRDTIGIIIDACKSMAKSKTGAIIVIPRKSSLETVIHTGDFISARISKELILSIFFKNNPLHDGAMIIAGGIIKAVRCILPVSEKTDLPPQYGMRHRAALGLTEESDAIVIVVSEQTGELSYSINGEIIFNISPEELFQKLEQNSQKKKK
jgi:diadenylate cyclase